MIRNTTTPRSMLVLVVAFSGVLPAMAQAMRGSIRGAVYDPRQSLVTGATVVFAVRG
jgi:hypothetical protein